MFLISERRVRREKGQAIILFVVAMGIVLIGALGLAIDGSQLYAHRQMLQAAADSGAQAGVMSVFNKTNTGTNDFGTGGSFTCSTTDDRTPCYYARRNGVGTTADDAVFVDFPTSAPGVNLSSTDTPNLVRVTVTRTVHNGIIQFVAPALSSVRATATAAIVNVISPTPILVLHPTLAGSLFINGNPTIQICGGPRRSIQVNSKTSPTTQFKGNPVVDLSRAGPSDPGNCTSGTGGDFGSFAGPTTQPSQIQVGSATYIQPSSPIRDPLIGVPAPAVPAAAPAQTSLANGVSGCPLNPGKACKLYSPGLYPTGIEVKNETAVFKPGVYYMQTKGFQSAANGDLVMSTGFANDAITGQGMLVYVTGNGTNDIVNVGSNGSLSLLGTPNASIYKGILFFSAHTSTVLKDHRLGGNGAVQLIGTIYLANTSPTATVYQRLTLQGTPGSSTHITGQIVVDALELGGNAGITMTLNPTGTLNVRQVALVN
ncbi:MAG: pilus assembly protein TadG-related protein [Bryobacteraceae bacterium]